MLDESLEDVVDPETEDRLAHNLREADWYRSARNPFVSKLKEGDNHSTFITRTGVESRLRRCLPDCVFQVVICGPPHAPSDNVIQD